MNFNVTNYGINFNNLEVNFKVQDKKGLISHDESLFININSTDEYYSDSITINLDEAELVHVYIDPDNNVNEPKDNNYMAVPVVSGKVRAYISIETGNNFVDDVIYDYLSGFVDVVSELEFPQLKIYVSILENNIDVKQNKLNSKYSDWYVDEFSIYSNGNSIGLRPYVGLVTKKNLKEIFVIGKDIEGVIAAVKRLINSKEKFFDYNLVEYEKSIIDDYDSLGISVFDLMHNSENKPYYLQKNLQFADVVKKILSDNNYETAIKTVKTTNDGTILRLKNVNSDFSSNYKDAIGVSEKPVVFAGGIFSNLFSWEEDNGLALQMAQEGWDTWEIEITGGPNTECDTCPNYSYEDLVDYYWPALISGVMEYSGKDQIDYVGHSNGCRVALSSLNDYSATGLNDAGVAFNYDTGYYDKDLDLPSNPVDTFFGLGCPVTLNDISGSSDLARILDNGIPKGDLAMNYLFRNNYNHIYRQDYAKHLNLLGNIFGATNKKISTNLMAFYNSMSIEKDTHFDIKTSLANNHLFFAGKKGIFGLKHFEGDGVVPISDLNLLNQSLINSKLIIVNSNHVDIIKNKEIKNKIKGDKYE